MLLRAIRLGAIVLLLAPMGCQGAKSTADESGSKSKKSISQIGSNLFEAVAGDETYNLHAGAVEALDEAWPDLPRPDKERKSRVIPAETPVQMGADSDFEATDDVAMDRLDAETKVALGTLDEFMADSHSFEMGTDNLAETGFPELPKAPPEKAKPAPEPQQPEKPANAKPAKIAPEQVVQKAEEWAKRMCQCTTVKCAQDSLTAFKAWFKENAGPKGNDSQVKRVKAAVDQALACMRKLAEGAATPKGETSTPTGKNHARFVGQWRIDVDRLIAMSPRLKKAIEQNPKAIDSIRKDMARVTVSVSKSTLTLSMGEKKKLITYKVMNDSENSLLIEETGKAGAAGERLQVEFLDDNKLTIINVNKKDKGQMPLLRVGR